MAQDSAENFVPDDLTVAIGAGVSFPSDIFVFNRASVKLAFGKSLQLEPFIGFQMESDEDKASGPSIDDQGNPTTDSTTDTDDTTSFAIGTNVMIPLATKNNSQLSLVASLAVAQASNTNNPDGDDNTVTSSALSFALGYGVAVEYWFSENISLSAIASTPLFTMASSSATAELSADTEATSDDSNSVVNLAWAPTVAATFNLWF